MIPINTIYKMDCLDGMKLIDDKSINMVLTDPPYNISRKTNFHTMHGHRGTSMDFGKWDKEADILSFISYLPRILKQSANVVIFNCWENLGQIAKQMDRFEITPKRCLVLNKSNPAPFNRDRLFVNDVEFAVWGVYKNKGWIFNRKEKLEKCIINTTVQRKKFHPTMKDLKVLTKLINILSNEDDLILDMFMGSGTTALACVENNRDFIGFEKSEKYCKIARERINTQIHNKEQK